jgi:hypothetical protein
MRCFRVIAQQVFASLVGNNSSFVVRSCHSPDCVNGVPEGDCDELNFIAGLSSEQIAAPLARQFADTRQKFWLQHGLICGGVLTLRISTPHSCDHPISLVEQPHCTRLRQRLSRKLVSASVELIGTSSITSCYRVMAPMYMRFTRTGAGLVSACQYHLASTGRRKRDQGIKDRRPQRSRDDGQYTCVSPERQNELTRRIQRRLTEAAGKNRKQKIPQSPVSICEAPGVEHVLSTDGSHTTHDIAAAQF